MYGTLVLLLIFLVWQAIDRRRSDEPLLPWLSGTRRKMQEKTHWDSVPPTEYVRRDFVMPPMRARIDSCYQTREQYLHDLQSHVDHPEELDELLTLLYTPGRMYRAAIFRRRRLYRAEYENLRLADEEELYWEYPPEGPCGWWEPGGESWFDDPEAAEETARAVLHQLESAEQEALTGADLPE